MVCEEQSGDRVSENIKLAVLQKYLCDGELARHLNLRSARLTPYDLARKEAINNLRAKQTWTTSGSSDPVDLSPSGRAKAAREVRAKAKATRRRNRNAWPQHERVQELLSCPEGEICSARQGWSERRCGSGSRDRQEKNLLKGRGRAR